MTQYSGPIWVTLAYIALYYVFMTLGLRTKLRLIREYREQGKVFDRYFGKDREMLAADRTQLNMLEHMPIFLVLLWLHAVMVSSFEATILGSIYTGLRVFYPVVLRGRIGRNIPKRVLPLTFSGYIILAIFAVRIAMSI
jgi:uncharacterized membrane protein YecN with MAPEG domain